MRTTVKLDDELLVKAKQRAAATGRTLAAVIEDALRASLAPRPTEAGERVVLPTFCGAGVQPGVDLDDTSALLDLMESPRRGPA